jgi:hypothetical protein
MFLPEIDTVRSKPFLFASIAWPELNRFLGCSAQNKPRTRVERDMVIVLPFGTTFPKTDKQNIIRPQVYRQFEALINHKYEGVEESEIVEPHGER